jgi:hypothetical protein
MKRIDKNIPVSALNKDLRDMDAWFKTFFEEEVDNDGFLSGGKSFLVSAHNAEPQCDIALACLDRANYDVYRTTPMEIIRRLEDKENLSDEDLDKAWLNADCYFIYGMFDDIALTGLSEVQKATVAWFVKEAVTYGNPVILPVANAEATDLDSYGTELGAFIETTFERVDGKINDTKKQRKNNSGSKPSGVNRKAPLSNGTKGHST